MKREEKKIIKTIVRSIYYETSVTKTVKEVEIDGSLNTIKEIELDGTTYYLGLNHDNGHYFLHNKI